MFKVLSLKGVFILLFFNFFLSGNAYSQYSTQTQAPSDVFTNRQPEYVNKSWVSPISKNNDGFTPFGGSGNALYAPPSGGDPISGVVPVGDDGIWFLLFLVISYGLFRSLSSKKQVITKFKASKK